MLARRVIAIAEEKGIAKRLGIGLKASGGSVETYASLDALGKGDIQASLIVVHAAGDVRDVVAELDRRLSGEANIIVILPRSDVADTVAYMRTSDKVAGVLTEDVLDGNALPEMATRLLFGDIFGAEKVVPYGPRIYSALVGDYQEKSVCISQISEYAGSMGVRRKYREAIEQCADEMLMNALYDAPVDQEGKPIFADVPTRTRISLRMEQKAVVQYACDGARFTLSVRDSFGTLDRDTVVQYLHKCLYSDQQIDRKTGGAGLGLYIIANATSMFLFNVLPGVATECVVSFDLTAPKVQLKRFGFFEERIDASGRLAAGASQLLPSGVRHPVERREGPASPTPRAVVWGLGGAIVLLLALIGLVAYPRFVATPTAPVLIETDPPGATVELDGRIRGTTTGGSLEVTGLAVDRAYRVTARKDGWNAADAVIEPLRGTTASVELSLDPKESVVFLESDPAGARVTHDDREIGATPLRVTSLPAGEEVEVSFEKTGYQRLTRTVRVPDPGGEATVSTTMRMAADVGSVRITSQPPDADVYINGEILPGRTTPIDEHIVEGGKTYTFTLKKAGFMPRRKKVEVAPGRRQVPVEASLRPGGALTVRANVDGRASVVGVKRCRRVRLPMIECPVPNGEHRVVIRGTRPYARTRIGVEIDGDVVAEEVTFGFVKAAEGYQLEVRGQKLPRAGFEPGPRTVKLVETETDTAQTVDVQIAPDRTITVPEGL